MPTIHPIDIHIGKQLRAKRNQHGITQEELAASVGVTFQQIQKYEQGKNRISGSRFYELANTLNCSVEYFFEGSDSESCNSLVSNQRPVDEKEWIKIRADFCRLPIPIQQSIRKLINSLSHQ
ncbi:helix-turn-helix domain-containing protein [Aquimarina macrocephali]|uniref:helix-turn-helix domain-containing protein n=1 Tax=Aquimarina macrocephali TaxID=666563 RepID=UPI000463CA0D|nr:helix-turn-helix transcriptional regulator [Aquimarina macrocephali]